MIFLLLPNLKALVPPPTSVAENSYDAFSEYLVEKKHLGGLLILLPTNRGDKESADDKGKVKGVLTELEKLLVHEQVPVSHSFSLIYKQIAQFDSTSITLVILDILHFFVKPQQICYIAPLV